MAQYTVHVDYRELNVLGITWTIAVPNMVVVISIVHTTVQILQKRSV